MIVAGVASQSACLPRHVFLRRELLARERMARREARSMQRMRRAAKKSSMRRSAAICAQPPSRLRLLLS